MSVLPQHFLVLAVVAVSAAWISRQTLLTFRSAKGGLGSCCSKGCGGGSQSSQQDVTKNSGTNPTVFVPQRVLTINRQAIKN
jgi:hypothetical protein